ncbi:MAG: hypothetical protein C4519_23685 [Desulfobacteraceae bacterium]|nr:MAG: hypothetical protein C4519_23685 [Desulfobacteraceae bacterium]
MPAKLLKRKQPAFLNRFHSVNGSSLGSGIEFDDDLRTEHFVVPENCLDNFTNSRNAGGNF